MERYFENIGHKKQPRCRTDEVVFGHSHGEEKDIGKCTCEVAYHGGEACRQAHDTTKPPIVGNGFGLASVPPIHHRYTKQDDDRHASFEEGFGDVFAHPSAEYDTEHHPRQQLYEIPPLNMPTVINDRHNIAHNQHRQ